MRIITLASLASLSALAFFGCAREAAPVPPVAATAPPPAAAPAATGAPGVVRDYPPTRRDDVKETLHGVSLTDPYRWLEDGSSPDVKAWLTEQGAYARKALDRLPERAELVKRFH